MHIHHASFHQNPPRISSLVITGVPTHTHSSCMHPFIKLTGASARRSLAPSRDFSTCQNASLGLLSCSPGHTSSRLSPPSLSSHLVHIDTDSRLIFIFTFSCPPAFSIPAPTQFSSFLQGDPSLVEAFEGLHPQQEKHQFQIDILPVS